MAQLSPFLSPACPRAPLHTHLRNLNPPQVRLCDTAATVRIAGPTWRCIRIALAIGHRAVGPSLSTSICTPLHASPRLPTPLHASIHTNLHTPHHTPRVSQRMLGLLSDIFEEFDLLCEAHDVDKIKVPTPTPTSNPEPRTPARARTRCGRSGTLDPSLSNTPSRRSLGCIALPPRPYLSSPLTSSHPLRPP